MLIEYWTKVQLTSILRRFILATGKEKMVTNPAKIFIVDDDAPVREALSRLLRSCGYDATAYSSAQDFLDSFSSDDAVRGCLILDVKMPGMNGLDLQEKLISSGLAIPIIFITAYDDPKDREKALKNGAAAFLQKPLNDIDLLRIIESVLKTEN
jgi:FixJ family two-component response regulator